LEPDLRLLRKLLPTKRPRGGIAVGRNLAMMELIDVLANMWLKFQSGQPGWTKDPDSGGLTGPFRTFVSLCTAPAGFEIPDSVLVRGIERWRARTKLVTEAEPPTEPDQTS